MSTVSGRTRKRTISAQNLRSFFSVASLKGAATEDDALVAAPLRGKDLPQVPELTHKSSRNALCKAAKAIFGGTSARFEPEDLASAAEDPTGPPTLPRLARAPSMGLDLVLAEIAQGRSGPDPRAGDWAASGAAETERDWYRNEPGRFVFDGPALMTNDISASSSSLVSEYHTPSAASVQTSCGHTMIPNPAAAPAAVACEPPLASPEPPFWSLEPPYSVASSGSLCPSLGSTTGAEGSGRSSQGISEVDLAPLATPSGSSSSLLPPAPALAPEPYAAEAANKRPLPPHLESARRLRPRVATLMAGSPTAMALTAPWICNSGGADGGVGAPNAMAGWTGGDDGLGEWTQPESAELFAARALPLPPDADHGAGEGPEDPADPPSACG